MQASMAFCLKITVFTCLALVANVKSYPLRDSPDQSPQWFSEGPGSPLPSYDHSQPAYGAASHYSPPPLSPNTHQMLDSFLKDLEHSQTGAFGASSPGQGNFGLTQHNEDIAAPYAETHQSGYASSSHFDPNPHYVPTHQSIEQNLNGHLSQAGLSNPHNDLASTQSVPSGNRMNRIAARLREYSWQDPDGTARLFDMINSVPQASPAASTSMQGMMRGHSALPTTQSHDHTSSSAMAHSGQHEAQSDNAASKASSPNQFLADELEQVPADARQRSSELPDKSEADGFKAAELSGMSKGPPPGQTSRAPKGSYSHWMPWPGNIPALREIKETRPFPKFDRTGQAKYHASQFEPIRAKINEQVFANKLIWVPVDIEKKPFKGTTMKEWRNAYLQRSRLLPMTDFSPFSLDKGHGFLKKVRFTLHGGPGNVNVWPRKHDLRSGRQYYNFWSMAEEAEKGNGKSRKHVYHLGLAYVPDEDAEAAEAKVIEAKQKLAKAAGELAKAHP